MDFKYDVTCSEAECSAETSATCPAVEIPASVDAIERRRRQLDENAIDGREEAIHGRALGSKGGGSIFKKKSPPSPSPPPPPAPPRAPPPPIECKKYRECNSQTFTESTEVLCIAETCKQARFAGDTKATCAFDSIGGRYNGGCYQAMVYGNAHVVCGCFDYLVGEYEIEFDPFLTQRSPTGSIVVSTRPTPNGMSHDFGGGTFYVDQILHTGKYWCSNDAEDRGKSCREVKAYGSGTLECVSPTACQLGRFYGDATVKCLSWEACEEAKITGNAQVTCDGGDSDHVALIQRTTLLRRPRGSACRGITVDNSARRYWSSGNEPTSAKVWCMKKDDCKDAYFFQNSQVFCMGQGSCNKVGFYDDTIAHCDAPGSCDGVKFFSGNSCCTGNHCPVHRSLITGGSVPMCN